MTKTIFTVLLLSVWCALLNGDASNCGEIKNDFLDLIKELKNEIEQQNRDIEIIRKSEQTVNEKLATLKHEFEQQKAVNERQNRDMEIIRKSEQTLNATLKHEIELQKAIIKQQSRDIEINRKTTGACCSSLIGWFKELPAKSCRWLRKNSGKVQSGLFWISLKTPTKMYCDMDKENDGGGWTMIGQAEAQTDSEGEQISFEKIISDNIGDLSNVTSKRFLLSGIRVRELQKYINFTQIRFFCHKPWHGRTLDIYTLTNDLGEGVVDLMTGKSNVRPQSCNSYARMKDDSSVIGSHCDSWYQHKWFGNNNVNTRMYNCPMYIENINHFDVDENWIECDDYRSQPGFNKIGRWAFYVR